MDDREKFDKYVEKINEVLRSDEFYQTFRRRLRTSKPQIKLAKKSRTKKFETDWIDMIESCITNLDNIVRNPRKFIVIEEDIVDISLARAISTESVKHLAQHTNLIASVDKEGMVTPNKILNTTKEESYEIYENRFIYTLLKNLSNFITRRMDAIKKAYVNDNILELDVDANFFMGKTRVFYNLELIGSLPVEVEEEIQGSDLAIVERVTKLQRIISDFLSSPFAKQMINSAPVRPPITRTNVILKNPDFKKALVLWQFIESYTKMGFEVENVSEKMPVDEGVETAVSDMMCISNLLMEGLIKGKVDDALFFDESNMTENEQQEGEKEQEDKQKEGEKGQEELPVPEAVEVPQEEETEQTDMPEEEKQEEEEDKDEDLPDDFGIAEIRNMFQQTDGKLDKAQLSRLNKAIDRVLLNERNVKAKKQSDIVKIQYRQQEIEQEEMLKQLEKEKETLQRTLAKKEKIAQKESERLERQRERDKKRLQKLEEEMLQRQREFEQQQLISQQEGVIKDEEQNEKLEDVEDLSVTPMLAALRENDDSDNASESSDVTEAACDVADAEAPQDAASSTDESADALSGQTQNNGNALSEPQDADTGSGQTEDKAENTDGQDAE